MLLFVTTLMNLEAIILCEASQIEKDEYSMISHLWNLKNVEFIKAKWDGGCQRLR